MRKTAGSVMETTTTMRNNTVVRTIRTTKEAQAGRISTAMSRQRVQRQHFYEQGSMLRLMQNLPSSRTLQQQLIHWMALAPSAPIQGSCRLLGSQ